MFNLEQAIAEWRRRMAGSGFSSADILEELESHLREEIEQQVQAGLTGRAAFEAALEHIGKPDVLQSEFAKLRPNNKVISPGMLRLVCFVCAPFFLVIGTWTFLEYDLSGIEMLLGVSGVVLISVYTGALPFFYRRLVSKPVAKALALLTFLFVLWPWLGLMEALHLIHVHVGIVPTMLLWGAGTAIVATSLSQGVAIQCDQTGVVPGLPAGLQISLESSQCLERARVEARDFHHDFIGTEHLLLGLLAVTGGPVGKMLAKLRLEPGNVRERIVKIVGGGGIAARAEVLRYTPRARKSLELASREAAALNQGCIGPEHIMLGLVVEGSGVAALVLADLNVRPEWVRAEILRQLGSDGTDGPQPVPAG